MGDNKKKLQVTARIIGLSVGISAVALFLSWVLFWTNEHATYFILCLGAIAIGSWYGGQKVGYITTAILTPAIVYLFFPPHYSFMITHISYLIDVLIFLFSSITITIIIEHAKNPNDIIMYKEQEKKYLRKIAHLEADNLKYQKEVKARDDFLSIASHELKTPLSAMLLQIQTALHNIRTVSLANFSVERLMNMLQSTEQQSKRLSKMINDLLNVSLITTGRLELEKEEVDLTTLVKDVVERFSDKAEKEGSPIALHAHEPVVGDWDKLRISQAVTNLISNAIKYGNGKPITIEVIKHKSMGRMTITDHGIGIPIDRQERIFERFERGVANHDYKGLGVGLYISQQIVNTHQGKIKLKSVQNEGSTFIIELPLKQKAMLNQIVVS
jgi:signal transduction histidine kinase